MQIKALTILSILSLFAVFSVQTGAQGIVQQTETHNVFKGLFYSVWSRLRDLNPHKRQSARAEVVYTAGIRGAESTETLIQPYWKDDLSQDKAFQEELDQYTQAQQLMDKGDLAASIAAFDVFIRSYSSSDLLANALISKGVSLGGLGKSSEAATTLSQFIERYPGHPLVNDARQMLTVLN